MTVSYMYIMYIFQIVLRNTRFYKFAIKIYLAFVKFDIKCFIFRFPLGGLQTEFPVAKYKYSTHVQELIVNKCTICHNPQVLHLKRTSIYFFFLRIVKYISVYI